MARKTDVYRFFLAGGLSVLAYAILTPKEKRRLLGGTVSFIFGGISGVLLPSAGASAVAGGAFGGGWYFASTAKEEQNMTDLTKNILLGAGISAAASRIKVK